MTNFDELLELEVEELVLTKSTKRAERRKKSVAKAKRKRDLSKQVNHFDWYDNLHQYSKNKIHCSCQMCRFRSDWNPNEKSHSTMKRELAVNQRLKELDKDTFNAIVRQLHQYGAMSFVE